MGKILKEKTINLSDHTPNEIKIELNGGLKNIDNQMEVLFHKEVQGIAPGQSAVFYEGNDLLGGGFISKKWK